MSHGPIAGAVTRLVIGAIGLYRTMISPMRPACCRFSPTCSQYAVEALTEFGLMRGSWLFLVRLTKCGPWHRGGWDPIPERRDAAVDAAVLRSDSFV